MTRRVIVFVLVLAAAAVIAWYLYATQGATISDTIVGGGTGIQSESAQAPVEDSSGIPGDATEATIEYVHDGDTVFLTDGRKVRLLGINTPEIGDNLECYGDEATAELRQMLPEGTHVWVLSDIEPLDQYGRSLLFIFTDDGANVNVALLDSGAAEVEMYDPNWLYQDELESAESAARAQDLGLWGACR
jgi:micrococcal nuclease